jgi:hypothetical protein
MMARSNASNSRPLMLDQYDPCRLHKEDAQVTITALGYFAQDSSIAG